MVNHKSPKPRVWVFMVDSDNYEDLRDLDHLDAILWGSNPNARQGDVVLMYRTYPYCDIAYVFSATSDPRPTRPDDLADMDYVIELGDKLRLSRPLRLAEIRSSGALSRWSFARHQQGIMRHKKDIRQEGFWESLRSLLVARNPSLARLLTRLEGPRPGSPGSKARPAGTAAKRRRLPLRVFISYSSPDRVRARNLYRKLREQPGLNLWFDKVSLVPTDEWPDEIVRAIHSSDVIVICLSSRSVRRTGFAQEEIELALNLFDEQPEGTLAILPVKLDKCEVPPRLARWHYAELFSRDGYGQLLQGIRKQEALLWENHTR